MMKHVLRAAGLSLLMISGVIACGGSDSGTSIEVPAAEPFESAHLTIEVEGEGPNVLLLPGLASNADVWDDTVAALKDRYTLHIVQVSGFGGAPARGNAEKTDILPTLRDELIRYAGTLEEKPALIGHSLGGLVTMMAGIEDSDAFEKLMAIDVLPFFSVLTLPDPSVAAAEPLAQLGKTMLLSQSDEVFSQRQAEALATLTKSDIHRELALSWSVASDRNVMAQAMYEVLVTDLREPVKSISAPLSVMYARDPDMPNGTTIEGFYQTEFIGVPGVQLVPIDNALHFIMFDQPEAFLAAIETFLAG